VDRHLTAKVGTIRILYGASTISLQAAVYPEHTLRALNMKEEEELRIKDSSSGIHCATTYRSVGYLHDMLST